MRKDFSSGSIPRGELSDIFTGYPPPEHPAQSMYQEEDMAPCGISLCAHENLPGPFIFCLSTMPHQTM
jgi:hypothetical protein